MEDITNSVPMPRWQQQLGLKSGDPAIPKLAAIDTMFKELWLPTHALPPDQRDERQRSLVEAFHGKSTPYRKKPDFEYGVDYKFGNYHGNPRSVRDNAANVLIDGMRGAPLWQMMKSLLYTKANGALVIVHLRGDRVVDDVWLKSEPEARVASKETLHALGLEYGMVNPFVVSDRPIQHVFDSDLIQGTDYPGNDEVITSSGDQHIFVKFNVKKFLAAAYGISSLHGTANISQRDPESPERMVARRPIIVLGGDSPHDTFRLSGVIADTITQVLDKKGVVPTDRLQPPIHGISDPQFGGSRDTASNFEALRAHTREVATEIAQEYADSRYRPLVVFNSRAMDGVAGDIMRSFQEFEYIGSLEAIEPILAEVKRRTETESAAWPVSPVLLGLPSAYEKGLSAFSPELFDNPSKKAVDDGAQEQIQAFVDSVKVEDADLEKFYQVIEKILRRAAGGDLETLNGKNVAIVLGASELESFVNKFHKIPKTFAIIKSKEPTAIAEELAGVIDPKKIRLIFIQPGQAIAKMVAQKTLGLES